MTVLHGKFLDVAGQPVTGEVWINAVENRRSVDGTHTVTKQVFRSILATGAFRTPQLDPGPVEITLHTGSNIERWAATIPETGVHDLTDLVESTRDYEPPVVGKAQAAAQQAVEAKIIVVESTTKAEDAATRAEQAATTADTRATVAVDAAQRAEQAVGAAASMEGAAPLQHTHTVADITDLDRSFAGKQVDMGHSPRRVVQRDAFGRIVLPPNTPAASHATSRQYVDQALQALRTELQAEILALKTELTTSE